MIFRVLRDDCIYARVALFCSSATHFVLLFIGHKFHGVAGTKAALVTRGLNCSILVTIKWLRIQFKWHQVVTVKLLYDQCPLEILYGSTFSSMYPDNFAEMSNQELFHAGRKQMDQTDQAIECSKMVCCQYILPFFVVLTQRQKICYCVMEEKALPYTCLSSL